MREEKEKREKYGRQVKRIEMRKEKIIHCGTSKNDVLVRRERRHDGRRNSEGEKR